MDCAIAALMSAYMSFRNATGRVEFCALLRRALAIGFSALAFLSIGPSAEADMILNGSFESTTLMTSGPFVTSGTGTAVDSTVADWTVDCAATANHACSTADPYLTLVFPGEGTIDDGYNGNALYGPMSATSPDGGNFVAADGDPSYSAPFPNHKRTHSGAIVPLDVLSGSRAASRLKRGDDRVFSGYSRRRDFKFDCDG